MGSKISKNPGRNTNQHDWVGGYPSPLYQFQPGLVQQGTFIPLHPPLPLPYSSSSPPPSNAPPTRRPKKKYCKIADNYRTLDEVTAALKLAGLESSNLIVGIDFTKSNEWTGAKSFNKKNLHHIGDKPNPYEHAISIIGRTLSKFDEDNLIPCYGFGDASTHDKDVFSFYGHNKSCKGFEDVLARYRKLVPRITLSGPTSFAPILEMAMTTVEQSGGQYHILLIIADGQVTRSVDTEPGLLSPQEQSTLEAVVKASGYPLSIVLVGVGDGPWDMIRELDDNNPSSAFDNFQFVNFTEIMSKNADISRKEAEFALSALMEIPSQYRATLEHGLLGCRRGNCPERIPLDRPRHNNIASSGGSTSHSQSQQSTPVHSALGAGSGTPPPSTSAADQLCPNCKTRRKDLAFGCGHQTCRDCGKILRYCPVCQRSIWTRLYLR